MNKEETLGRAVDSLHELLHQHNLQDLYIFLLKMPFDEQMKYIRENMLPYEKVLDLYITIFFAHHHITPTAEDQAKMKGNILSLIDVAKSARK